MIKESTTTKTITEKRRYCDICEQPAKTQCCKCKKDLCNKHVYHEDYSISDYRGDCFCQSCYEIGRDYMDKVAEYEAKIEQLYDEWELKCVKNR